MDSRRMDSALGRQCGSIALFAKGTNAKFANLSQKAQSSHSPTAIPRILEEESGVSPSLRDLPQGKSWQSTSKKNKKRKKWILALCHCETCASKSWQSAASLVIHKNTKDT